MKNRIEGSGESNAKSKGKDNAMRKKAKPGDRVCVITPKEEIEGLLLESFEPGITLVKLPSGYNIGLRNEDILEIKVLEKQGKREEKTEKLSRKQDLANIAMIATGGTISSRLDPATGGVKWLSSPQELIRLFPEIAESVNIVSIESPFRLASENMSPDEWKVLAEKTAMLLNKQDVDGVIITRGTDFLHYSSAALSFMLRNLNKPVAFTYSQRSIDRGSSDAKLNLLCSARVAYSDIAEVVLVGHATLSDNYCYAIFGTKARKMHSSRRDAFQSINAEPLAKVWPDKLEILQAYRKRDMSKEVKADTLFCKKIALVKFYPGQKPDILEYYLAEGYRGVVIEGSGLGHVASSEVKHSWLPAIRKLVREGMVVCMTTQTIYGRVDPYVYSPGRELLKAGVLYLGDMLPETAFVKLGWVLGHKQWRTAEKVREMMLHNFAHEFSARLVSSQFRL